MPEITEDEFRRQFEDIPPEKRRAAMEKLKANGYTIADSSPTPAPVSATQTQEPSFNPLQPPNDVIPSSRAMPPGGEMRAADLPTRLRLALPQPISEAIEPGQTGMNRNILGGMAEFLTEGGPGGAAALSPAPGQFVEAPTWAAFGQAKAAPRLPISMKLGEETLPLTPAEITQSPAFAAAERLLHNVPFSANIMQSLNQIRNAAVRAYRDGLLSRLGEKIRPEALGSLTQESIQTGLESRALVRETELGIARKKALLPGVSATPEQVGGNLQAGIQSAVEKRRALASKAYRMVGQDLAPELQTLSAQELQKKAAQILLEKGGELSTLRSGSGRSLEPTLKRIISAKQGQSWDKMHDLQSDYGKLAESARKKGDSIEAMFWKDLKTAARADMKKAAQNAGGKVWDNYEFATSFWKDYKTNYDNEIIRKFIKLNPSEVYSKFIVNGAVETIDMLRTVSDSESWQKIQKLFIEDIVGAGGDKIPSITDIAKKLHDYRFKMDRILTSEQLNQVNIFAETGKMPQFVQGEIERNLYRIVKKYPSQIYETVMRGEPEIARTIKNIVGSDLWKMYERNFVEKLIGEAGGELLGSDKMARIIGNINPEYRKLFLSDVGLAGIQKIQIATTRMNTGEKIWGNASGTARNVISYSAVGAVFNDIKKGTSIVLGAPILAKFYLSPVGRELLVNGANSSKLSAAGLSAKISAFALNAEREIRDENKKYYDIVGGVSFY